MTLPYDVSVLVRGWLHGSCVALSGRGGPPALIDTGYHTGVAALAAWFEASTGRPIEAAEAIGLTHIHSDHAGGVAALVARSGTPVLAHRDAAALAEGWDTRLLWLDGTSQEMPRFAVDRALASSGERVDLGGRSWEILWTPGHAVGGVAWWCPEDGVLVTGDALWEDGFGLLNPWVDGPGVFDLTELALDRLSAIAEAVRVVIPGHGAPFTDAPAAVARARSRLTYLRRNPHRHRRQVLFNLAAFASLARPDMSQEAMREHVREAARSFAPAVVGDVTAGSADSADREPGTEAVVEEVLSALYRGKSSTSGTSGVSK